MLGLKSLPFLEVGLEMMMNWIDVEESPRMLQNKMEKGLGAELIAAVELFELFLIILKEW